MCGPACWADADGMTFRAVDRLLQTFLGPALMLVLVGVPGALASVALRRSLERQPHAAARREA